MILLKQQEADKIKARLRKQQERDDLKAFIGKNNKKQPTISGRTKRRLPTFTF